MIRPYTLGLLLLMTAAIPASAATLLVYPNGSGGYATIQDAIQAASHGDIIELGSGVFTGAGNRDLSFEGKAITVRSVAGDASACIIDCQGSPAAPQRGFSFTSGESASSVLADVTIRNGYASPGGGAIYVDGSSPVISGCTFEQNSAHGGGAIWVFNGAGPVIRDCRFSGNSCSGQNGGALLIGQNSDPTVERCTFMGNGSAAFGGAVLCYTGSEPGFIDCDFLDNSGPSTGGAVYLGWNSHASFDGCLFAGNVSSLGGGALRCYENSDPSLHNCTFYANEGEYGGALYVTDSSHPVLENCIIAFSLIGEAIHLANGGQASLACCDLYGNQGGDWLGEIAAQYGVNGNFSSDPLFCDADSYDCSLQETSPCTPANNPSCGLIGSGSVGCGTQGLEEGWPQPGTVRTYALPNPARGGVEIHYVLREGSAASGRVDIYDATGRRVRTLPVHTAGAGDHHVSWDGADEEGRAVQEGVYFYRLQIGEQIVSRHLVMLR